MDDPTPTITPQPTATWIWATSTPRPTGTPIISTSLDTGDVEFMIYQVTDQAVVGWNGAGENTTDLVEWFIVAVVALYMFMAIFRGIRNL